MVMGLDCDGEVGDLVTPVTSPLPVEIKRICDLRLDGGVAIADTTDADEIGSDIRLLISYALRIGGEGLEGLHEPSRLPSITRPLIVTERQRFEFPKLSKASDSLMERPRLPISCKRSVLKHRN